MNWCLIVMDGVAIDPKIGAHSHCILGAMTMSCRGTEWLEVVTKVNVYSLIPVIAGFKQANVIVVSR